MAAMARPLVGAVVVDGVIVVEAAVVGSEVADEEEDSGLSTAGDTAGDTAEETDDWKRVSVTFAVVVAMEDFGNGGGEVLDNR